MQKVQCRKLCFKTDYLCFYEKFSHIKPLCGKVTNIKYVVSLLSSFSLECRVLKGASLFAHF